MRADTPCVTLWRVVLEASSPLSIGAGHGDGVDDVVLTADANGLPALPASSLAGVLRATMAADAGEAAAMSVFGHASALRAQVSRFESSHGRLHDSRDRPVRGLHAALDDPLLAPLLARKPARRQRVRIDHRGTADDQALFDRTVLAAGHRFSVELALWSAQPAEGERAWVDQVLASGLAVGAQTRSGLGALHTVRAHRRDFDLRRRDDLQLFSAFARDPDATQGMAAIDAPVQARPGLATLRLRIQPEAGFRFGAGHRSLREGALGKAADDLPKTEARVVWTQGRGRLTTVEEEPVLIPASSIKGAIAHRVAFHAQRLRALWATPDRVAGFDKSLHCETVRRLFGSAADERAGKGDTPQGQAGLLRMADVTLSPRSVRAQTQIHNSVDRFTGGVRDGLLYAVENLYAAAACEPLVDWSLHLDVARARCVNLQALDLQALEMALDDLVQGRLALGADGASGQGFFQGRWEWEGGRPVLTAAVDAIA